MKKVPCEEKLRESLRFSTYLKALFYIDGKKEGFDNCSVLNISYEGVCVKLYSHDKIQIGTRINLGLIYKWKPISVKGVFKWTRKVGKCYVGGIELTKGLDVFTVIKCYNVGTSRKEQEGHCNYFMRAFCKIQKSFSKNKRNIKDVNNREKITCLINDFKIQALEKIEHIENQANSTFNECDTILKALNDAKKKLIRLKNLEESLKKKIIWNGRSNSRSLSHLNLINTEAKILDIKEFKLKQILSANTQPSDTHAVPDVD